MTNQPEKPCRRGAVAVCWSFLLFVGTIDAGNAMDKAMDGTDLYKTVETYAALGNHRVGTEVDAKTIAWFAGELERFGGDVERQPFEFDRFEGTSQVAIDGKSVPSMPLYYEGLGTVESDQPYTAAVVAMTGDRTSQALTDTITDAQEDEAPIAVIATLNPAGELQTPNRYPKVASGLPVVLVPGRYAEALKTGKVSVQYTGKLVSGKSANVVATFGDPSQQPILIATPLSGWFECAAERGTGIAIALDLARRLAPGHSVLVVGSPGHEILHHIGLEAYLSSNRVDASLILHLGANLALGEKDPATGKILLAPGINDPKAKPGIARTLFVRMDPKRFDAISPHLKKADLPAVLNPPKWSGEGALWARAGSGPLMSFVGIGPLFHTPSDVPEKVTSPKILEQVYEAIAEAMDTFVVQSK